MASGVYAKARGHILKADLDLDGDIRAVLVTADYTADLAAHDFLDDVPAPSRIGTPVALVNKTISADGVVDADDTTFPTVDSGADPIVAVVLFLHTGADATAKLLAKIDLPAPFVPDDQDLVIRWSGTDKILKAL